MFNCSKYEYFDGEIFCVVACLYTGQLGKCIGQIAFINMGPSSAI